MFNFDEQQIRYYTFRVEQPPGSIKNQDEERLIIDKPVEHVQKKVESDHESDEKYVKKKRKVKKLSCLLSVR